MYKYIYRELIHASRKDENENILVELTDEEEEKSKRSSID